MPTVRMLTSVAGTDPVTGVEFAWEQGQEVSMPPGQAAVWADGVRGELVRGEPVQTPEATSERFAGQVETPEGARPATRRAAPAGRPTRTQR